MVEALSASGFTCAARLALLVLTIGQADSTIAADPPARIYLGHFSEGLLNGWEEQVFSGRTQYSIEQIDGDSVLRAQSQSAASGLLRRQRIDLQEYPFLNWRWKVSSRLPQRDETTKNGDDYPVRLYVVVGGGVMFWNSKSLNYVWSRNLARGSTWANAFAERNVVMLSLRDKQDATGVWHEEKRNVLEDLQRYLGADDIRYIVCVAVMTDTDNTESSVESYYGDIYFSGE